MMTIREPEGVVRKANNKSNPIKDEPEIVGVRRCSSNVTLRMLLDSSVFQQTWNRLQSECPPLFLARHAKYMRRDHVMLKRGSILTGDCLEKTCHCHLFAILRL